MTWVGDAGLVLLGAGVIVALGGMVAVLPSALRARRASLETARLVEMYRHTVEVKMLERTEILAEQDDLLRPFRAIGRVLSHPLAVALYGSYRLRRRRARQALSE